MPSLKRNSGLLALTTVVVAASALVASLVQTKVYRATAVVRVPDASQRAAELGKMRSARVRSEVRKQTGTTPDVTVKASPRADQIVVSAESTSARGAANLANGYVSIYVGQVRADREAANAPRANELRAHAADLQRQIDALTASIAGARPQAAAPLQAQRDGLQRQLTDTQAQLDQLNAGPLPTLATAAKAPSAAIEPHTLRNTLLGLAVGLAFGLLTLLVLWMLGRRRERPTAEPRRKAPPLVPAASRAGGAVSVAPVAPRTTEPRPHSPPTPTPTPAASRPPAPAPSPPPAAAPEPAHPAPAAPAPPPQPIADHPPEPEPAPSPTPSVEAASVPDGVDAGAPTISASAVSEPPGPNAPVEKEQAPPEMEEEPAVDRSGPGVPVLGIIPAVDAWRGKERPVLRRDQPASPAAEAYRALAATIQRILPHRPLRSLVVTSPARADGRTTVVANLGIVLARAGRTVVAVDCDLRNPHLHEVYGVGNEAGFTSVLRGEAPLSRAVQQVPGEARLQILSAGPTPPAPGQLLSAQRTVEVFAALQAQADVVVIDVPVMARASDAAVVSSIVDAALVIAGAPSGQAGELARAVDLLDEVEGLVVGVVLNAVTEDDQEGRVAMLRRDMPRVSLA